MSKRLRNKTKQLFIGLASLVILALAGNTIFRSFQQFRNEKQRANQGLVIPGNEDTYAKAIAESYSLVVQRYVVPVSPKLLFLSAQDTIELFEQHWSKEEQQLDAEGEKTILTWEREARYASDAKKAASIRAPQREQLSEEQSKKQEQQFAAEFAQYSPKALKQSYRDFLAKAKLQGLDTTALAENLYTEIMSALCRPLHDPFSGFFQDSGFYQLSDTTNGSFGGVGLYITKKALFTREEDETLDAAAENSQVAEYLELQRSYVKVSRPFPGGPSFQAGIMADDFIYAVDGESAKDWSVEQVQNKVRGVPGSKVKITVLRAHQHPIDFEVVRERIEVPAVTSDMIHAKTASGEPVNILYVELSQFNAVAGKQFDKQVQELLQQNDVFGVNGMILDMRNNPGGLLNVAVDIADQFLSDGLIVSTDARTSDNVLKFSARKTTSIPDDLPVFVMVNGESASAAEIVAGALQDHQRAEVVGQKSYGKGSVQIPISSLPEGILKITIAHFYTPKGVNLANNGIQPDREFTAPELTEADREALVKLLQADIIGNFVNQHPRYTDDEFWQFYQQQIKSSYNISLEIVKRLAYGEKMRFMKQTPAYSLDYDIILRQVVDYIKDKLL